MTQMWRKVTRMLESSQKPEKRGAPVLLDDELPEFKARLIQIIKSLRTRSLPLLRQEFLPVINEIRVRNGRKPSDNLFKEHKWSDFVNHPKNKDILDLLDSFDANDQLSTACESNTESDVTQPQSESDSYGLFSPEEIAIHAAAQNQIEEVFSNSEEKGLYFPCPPNNCTSLFDGNQYQNWDQSIFEFVKQNEEIARSKSLYSHQVQASTIEEEEMMKDLGLFENYPSSPLPYELRF